MRDFVKGIENRDDRVTALIELVALDLEFRWKSQKEEQPYSLDHYFSLYPELGTPESPPLALVQEEYRVRKKWDESFNAENYVERFEQLGISIRAIVKSVDRHLDEDAEQKDVVKLPIQIDRYLLSKHLATGGMGSVYLAAHAHFEKRRYAVKLLNRRCVDDVAIKRFEKEIWTAGQLEHPNIVYAQDTGFYIGQPYLVMEYIDGSDLQSLVDSGAVFSIANACKIVSEVTRALQYAYEHEIVHRDLKPANIMLSKKGEVKLLDLGLAKWRDQSDQLTLSGQMMGTPDFMSPEQWNDSSNVGIGSDIYSLGCTLFTLLAGHPPYFDPDQFSVVERMKDHCEQPVPDIRQVRNDIPESLSQVIRKSLSKTVEERYRDPNELRSALKPFSEGSKLDELVGSGEVTSDRNNSETQFVGNAEVDTSRIVQRVEKSGHHSQAPGNNKKLKSGVAVMAFCLVGLAIVYGSGLLGGFGNEESKTAGLPTTPEREHSVQLTAVRRTNEGVWIAKINDATADGRIVFEEEFARLEVDFDQPVYFMIFAMLPDGGKNRFLPIWPADVEELPQKGTGFLYPPVASEDLILKGLADKKDVLNRSGYWVFNDGIGMHGFIVVSSAKKLPPFSEVNDKLTSAPWFEGEPKERYWVIENKAPLVKIFDQSGKNRGPGDQLEQNLTSFCDHLESIFPTARFDGIAFYVDEPY